MLTDILIVFFCITVLSGGVMVVFARNPSRSLFGLLLTALSIGFMFLLLATPFVAMVQIIVYTGAVLMLFLFVVRYFVFPSSKRKLDLQNPMAVIAVVIILLQIAIPLAPFISRGVFAKWDNPPDVALIGNKLFTDYLYPFELVSILLLVAIIGAIYMAREQTAAEEREEDE